MEESKAIKNQWVKGQISEQAHWKHLHNTTRTKKKKEKNP